MKKGFGYRQVVCWGTKRKVHVWVSLHYLSGVFTPTLKVCTDGRRSGSIGFQFSFAKGLHSRAGAPLLIYIYTRRHVVVTWAFWSRSVSLRDVSCSLGIFCGIKGVACLDQSLFKLHAVTPTLLRATDHEILFYFRRQCGCLLAPFQCFHFESTWWAFYLSHLCRMY